MKRSVHPGHLMSFRNPDLLLYCGMADAYAAAAEFAPALTEKLLLFTAYEAHPHLSHVAGHYTDDTQMSVATSHALLREPLNALTEHSFARAFVHQYKNDPRSGYSKKFQEEVLEPCSRHANCVVGGHQLLQFCRRSSDRNGAAMRSVPLGVIASPTEVVRVAKLQAKITHNTPGGIFSAQLVALMSHYALYETSPLSDLKLYLKEVLPALHIPQLFDLDMLWGGPVGSRDEHGGLNLGVKTVHAVYTLLITTASLLEMMRQILIWGGDTDTVATIAWGIASARYQNEILPDFFRRDFEQGSFGKEYLQAVGNSLMVRT